MKIMLSEMVQKLIGEVDVEFPFYCKYDFDVEGHSYTNVFTKIIDEYNAITISEEDNFTEIKYALNIERNKYSIHSSICSALTNRGNYERINESIFNEKLELLKEFYKDKQINL